MNWFAEQLNFNLHWVANIIGTVALLMGIAMFLSGIFQLKKLGESRTMMSSEHSAAGPLMMLLAGAALMILPTFIDSALLAFWSTDTPLRYEGGSGGYDALVPPILLFIRIVGVISFIRGIVLLSRTGGRQSQPGTMSRAMIHLLAGILCVHILGTLELLGSIMGLAG